MSITSETAHLDATALAELVRKGDVTPLELVDAAIERVEEVNPTLNAVVTPMYDLAREAAQGDLPDGPFRGVPMVLKDLLAQCKGVPMKCGSKLMEHFVPKRDSEHVKRYRNAGLIIVGKSSTPEFGYVATTEAKLYGPTHNPWNTEHSPGGSSGGSASAVASHMVPIGHASDGGGSIRIPASCCGLVGLKPTRGRVSLAPMLGDAQNGLAIEHAVTRSVRDSAILLDAVHGHVPGDPYFAPPVTRPFAEEVGADPGKLRIAVQYEPLNGHSSHPDCVEALRETVKVLEDLGHHVEEAAPPIDGVRVGEAFGVMWAGGAGQTLGGIGAMRGKPITEEDVEPVTWSIYQAGFSTTAGEYLTAVTFLQSCGRKIAGWMNDYDLWMTPTLAKPPVKLGELDFDPADPSKSAQLSAEYVAFTPVVNATGQPAISLPLHWNEDGLPVGVHFVAPFGDEAALIRIASQLEEAKPWRDKRPAVCAANE